MSQFQFPSIRYCLHRRSKDDTWVSNNTYWELRKDPGFAHIDFPTLWWPLYWRLHTFQPAQPLLWTRLALVMSVLQSYCAHSVHLIALVASAYLTCVNMFMQAYYVNVDQFKQFCPHFHIVIYNTAQLKQRKGELCGIKKSYTSLKCTEQLVTLAFVLPWTFSTSEIN